MAMLDVVVGLVVFSVLCLSSNPLRLYGFLGVTVLTMLFPLPMLTLLGICGCGYWLLRRHSKPTKGA